MKLRHRITDFRNGIESGYPLCCVLRYSLSRWDFQAYRRGGSNERGGFVTCDVFHKATSWTHGIDHPPTRYGAAGNPRRSND